MLVTVYERLMEAPKNGFLGSCPVLDSICVILDKIRSHAPSKATGLAMSFIELVSK